MQDQRGVTVGTGRGTRPAGDTGTDARRKEVKMREIVAQLGRTVRFALTRNPRTARLCAILVVAVLVYDLVTRR